MPLRKCLHASSDASSISSAVYSFLPQLVWAETEDTKARPARIVEMERRIVGGEDVVMSETFGGGGGDGEQRMAMRNEDEFDEENEHQRKLRRLNNPNC